jgi:hypothetical protein
LTPLLERLRRLLPWRALRRAFGWAIRALRRSAVSASALPLRATGFAGLAATRICAAAGTTLRAVLPGALISAAASAASAVASATSNSSRITTAAKTSAFAAVVAAASTKACIRYAFEIAARLHINHLKINRMVVHIHPRNADFHFITNAIDLRGTFADQHHMKLVEVVIVIRHIT